MTGRKLSRIDGIERAKNIQLTAVISGCVAQHGNLHVHTVELPVRLMQQAHFASGSRGFMREVTRELPHSFRASVAVQCDNAMSHLATTLAPFSGPGLLARAERKWAAPVSIVGVPFDHVTMSEAIGAIEDIIASRRPHYIATANVDFVVQSLEDSELRCILVEADMVLCDGTPLVWVSRWLGNPLPERVAGADLVPELLAVAAEKGYRIFFLGGKPDVAARAVERLRSTYPGIEIAGHYSPPFAPLDKMDHGEICRRIREAHPDILFVSFGCPKAEKWISMNHRALGGPVSMGVGATIDFLAGEVKRAPVWMQRSGLEWLFRFLQEPSRLGPRYAKDLRRFGWAIGRQLRCVDGECGLNDALTATFSLQVVRILAPVRLD